MILVIILTMIMIIGCSSTSLAASLLNWLMNKLPPLHTLRNCHTIINIIIVFHHHHRHHHYHHHQSMNLLKPLRSYDETNPLILFSNVIFTPGFAFRNIPPMTIVKAPKIIPHLYWLCSVMFVVVSDSHHPHSVCFGI